MRKKKVVIFTGGGYFGVTIAAFLSYLPEDYLLPKHVDVLAGTSIGGIITCALMAGRTGKEILDGFVKDGKRIFTRRWQNKINPLSIPFYDNKVLGEVVERFVGDLTIGDATEKWKTDTRNTFMFVPATNMTKNKLKVFDNADGTDFPYTLKDVSLYTSAAEFYFDVLNDKGDAITDGGIRECSPVVTTACGINSKIGWQFKDLDVLVFGVGQSIDGIDKGCGTYEEVKKWGVLDWIRKFVIPDVTNSNISMSQFWGEHLGFNSFRVFNPIYIKGSLDNTSTTDHILRECSMYKDLFLEVWAAFMKGE